MKKLILFIAALAVRTSNAQFFTYEELLSKPICVKEICTGQDHGQQFRKLCSGQLPAINPFIFAVYNLRVKCYCPCTFEYMSNGSRL